MIHTYLSKHGSRGPPQRALYRVSEQQLSLFPSVILPLRTATGVLLSIGVRGLSDDQVRNRTNIKRTGGCVLG